ncbi:uncharacterized protein LOC127789279 [Diospyros lotus]|uniref:uncharacterized protein LOC127789279 n=1 Tax=Diospyros lotus TaxID=55363 RepID=UPI00225A5FC3|nr:uncharacterized protein LOC127789279 [Diospyros lotus]
MISFRAIQGSFTLTRHGLFQPRGLSNKKNLMVLSVSKSSDSNSEDSQSQPPEGDARKQELLARIAMLQTQKVRLTDYLDERSAYLTQFAEEANAEFDQIGEDALKGLDEASARIMENIESRMQAFEESAESNKVEIEKNEKMLAEFEGQIDKDRNEGLFFKNLRETKPVEKAKAKEIEKIRELTVDSAGSRTRRNIYLVLIGLIAIGIVDSLLSPSAGWQKVAVLGVILVGLVSQLFFEQRLIAETERIEKQKGEHEKE